MDLDTMLAQADPAPHLELDLADLAAADRLYREITRPTGPRRRSAGHWSGRRGWPAVTAGAAVLAAAAVTAGVLSRPAARPATATRPPTTGQTGPAGRAPVAAVLAAAAVRAARGAGAGQTPGPGQFLYVKEVVAKGLGSAHGCATAPMTVQAWVTADGSGRQIGTFPAPCGKLSFDQTYQPGGLPWQLYGYVKAGSLPTDPAALRRAIVQRFEHGRSLPSATFIYAATFLNAGSPPALRAALYRVIETLPGVRNLGTVTDRLGRPGQGIGLVTAGARTELIYDPGSTSVLEEETVAAGPPQAGDNQLPAGTVMQYTLYVHQGLVNSTSARPAPSGKPAPTASTPPPSGTPAPAASPAAAS
jgi:hypothetical protein